MTGKGEKFSSSPVILLCKNVGICYNQNIQTIPEEKDNGLLRSIRRLNKQQSAGLAFTASSLISLLFSFIFVIALLAGGVSVGEEKPDWYLYLSFLLPQLAFLAVACVCFFLVKIPVKEVAGKPSAKYFVLAVLLQFGLLSLSQLNGWFVQLFEGIGYVPSPVVIPSTEGFELVGVMLVVALLPAVLEELIFRGFVLRGLKEFGVVFSVLVCGGLFALYHQNPIQTAYQFCCGAAFALMAFRSGSVFPTMLAHFINNAAIVLVYHFTGVDEYLLPWYVVLLAALCLVGTLAYLFFFDKKEEKIQSKKPSKKAFFAYAAVGIVVCLINWISALFS